jgi:predicted nucleic acid-binding protein
LHAFHPGLPEFIELRPVTEPGHRLPGTETLGRREAEAIKLTKEIRADLLLVDDRKASAAAERLGISCAALLALVVQAKQNGRISSLSKFIGKLETIGGLYLSEAVKAQALELAGE